MTKNHVQKKIALAISTLFYSANRESTAVEATPRPTPSMDTVNSPPRDGSLVDWRISETKVALSKHCNQGRLNVEIVNLLRKEGLCIPAEFELLDYKESIDASAFGKAKLARHVVSFFNSLGGYIIFGVKEVESETTFEVVGIDPTLIDLESIKATIKSFTGERIQVSSASFPVLGLSKSLVQVVVLHIPKRANGTPPLHFLKDGPEDDRKRKIFKKEDVYYRRADECVEAKGPKILELNEERNNPYLMSAGDSLARLLRPSRISHNLPDRNFVCPRFVGRDSTVNELWRWLGDDLSHVKVLAGEGGLGKTSIAFQFAERVSETQAVPFEQILWLTAKSKQFDALEDRYVNVPDRQFNSYHNLLIAVCSGLAFTGSELDGVSAMELRRMVKRGLTEFPSLLIIDDVDSLETEEQRQVLELGMILGDSKSRVLLTTRFNQSFSSDNVIRLSGLSLDSEFSEYLEVMRERLNFPELTSKEAAKIHAASGGSPLFTESILRLLKWMNVRDAIGAWKGERGSTVRAAALRREIEMLSAEARGMLLSIAMLEEASMVELAEVLGYTAERIEHGLEELLSLFLVAAPTLASIRRFRVPDNTRRLVLDPTTSLVADRPRLEKEVADFRRKAQGRPNRDTRVAAAISQAAALARIGDADAALKTIQDARRRTQDHCDLLSYQARLHLEAEPPQNDDARTLARRAFHAGGKKVELFECWFEAEWRAEHFIGALEASEAALDTISPTAQEWLIRKAAALASKAHDQAKNGSVTGAIGSMFEASTVLRVAVNQRTHTAAEEWTAQQHRLHDQIWIWTGADETGLGRTVVQIDTIYQMLELGDSRVTNRRRMLSAIEAMTVFLDRKLSSISSIQRAQAEQQISRASAYMARKQVGTDKTQGRGVETAWSALKNRALHAATLQERR